MDIKTLENHPTAWKYLYLAMQEAGVKFQANGVSQYCYFSGTKESYRIELPHQALRDTYKDGQKWQWRSPVRDIHTWRLCNDTPLWETENEYQLVSTPRLTARIVRTDRVTEWEFTGTREEYIAACERDGYTIVSEIREC